MEELDAALLELDRQELERKDRSDKRKHWIDGIGCVAMAGVGIYAIVVSDAAAAGVCGFFFAHGIHEIRHRVTLRTMRWKQLLEKEQ